MDRYLPKLSERQKRWARFAGLLLGVVLLGWVGAVLREVLTPIVAALALAYILNPAVTWLEKRRDIRRATSICVGLALLVLTGGVLLFAGTVQIVQLAGELPSYTAETIEWLDTTIPGLFATPEGEPSEAVTTSAPSSQPAPVPSGFGNRQQLLTLATSHGLAIGRALISHIATMLSDAFYWLSLVVLLPLYTFFFLLHFNDIVTTIHDHLPAAYRPTIVRVVTTIDRSISNFFRGRLLVCAAIGALNGIGWLSLGWFGITVPYNLALGALSGLLSLVPFMSVLALPPALFLTYFETTAAGGNWVVATTAVVGVYMVVQAIESFVLTPTIEAKAAGLHPVTTVIVLMIGGQFAGLLGMLLAIPITSTLKSLGIEYVLPEVKRLAKESAETEPAAEPPPPTDDAPDAEAKEKT